MNYVQALHQNFFFPLQKNQTTGKHNVWFIKKKKRVKLKKLLEMNLRVRAPSHCRVFRLNPPVVPERREIAERKRQ